MCIHYISEWRYACICMYVSYVYVNTLRAQCHHVDDTYVHNNEWPVIFVYLLLYFHLCATTAHCNIFIALIVYLIYSLLCTYLLSYMVTNFSGKSLLCDLFLYLLYCLNCVHVCFLYHIWLNSVSWNFQSWALLSNIT